MKGGDCGIGPASSSLIPSWQWKCDDDEVVGFMITRKEGEQLEIKWTNKVAEEAKAPSPPTSLLSSFGF